MSPLLRSFERHLRALNRSDNTIDLSGRWETNENWTDSVFPKRRWTTIALQQEGDKLTGQARTIGSTRKSPGWIVEQTLIGSLVENYVQLVATNFEVLKSPPNVPVDWKPDSWRGEVESLDLITGEMLSGDWRGTFTMKRVG